TRAVGDFITTSDIWFRPVDSTVGPDGALYVADWYDYNISHSSPKNRSKWYQPSKDDGRVWRVAPNDVMTIPSGRIDLGAQSSDELIELLSHPNDWYARQARQIFAERRDRSVVPRLKTLLASNDQRLVLQALWSIYVSGGFDEELAKTTLRSKHEYVRAWAVRLLGDERSVSPRLPPQLTRLAGEESSLIVRSQLACTAKRLPADAGIPIVRELLRHDEDAEDIHVPLLLWWAIEDKAISDTNAVLRLVESSDAWQLPLVRQFIIERLARRLTAEGTEEGFAACARLLAMAPSDADVDLILAGMLGALSGRRIESVPQSLKLSLDKLAERRNSDPKVMQLALRMGASTTAAVRFIENANRPAGERVAIIRALGETRSVGSTETLLSLIRRPEADSIQTAVLSALGFFQDDRIAADVLSAYKTLKPGARSRAIDLLSGRPSWAIQLLDAVEKKSIDPKQVTLTQVRQLLQHDDKRIQTAVVKTWGKVQPATPLQKQGRISAVTQLLYRGKSDTTRGLIVYEKTCASCHKLHSKGTPIGPDLTGAERKDRQKLIRNVVDPNAEVRPQYISHIAVTTDGRVLTGLLAGSTAETITLLDAKNKRTVLNRADVEELRESTVSLMPEKLLDELTDQQIRDLIAYLQSDGPSK
ncbi:MAG: c-type cytochrome, partial [Planctomycetaceae bacterium]|nr:c-type cytochrome [Planctomycetaceae bacterium]